MGRFQGRGGRGARGGRGNTFHKTPKRKKAIEDYYFYVGSSKQASDFETTYEFLLNHIKKTYTRGNDISEALRTLEDPDSDKWKPTLIMSTETDVDLKVRENRQYELEHKAEYDEYMKRKREYEQNSYKAYAEIWERCNKAMQSKLEARKNFESEVYNNPIKLIEAIKEHAMSYEESRYEMSIITDAFGAFFKCHQKDKEILQDYTRRFKVTREILKSHLGGDILLPKYVKGMTGYDESNNTKTEELTKIADEQLSTYVYLVNSDQRKYGTLIKGLHSQNALNNDQYPKTMVEANNVLSTHRHDNIKDNNREHNRGSRRNENNENQDNETKDEPVELSFAQLEGKCYCCGKPGHKSPQCFKKDKIPREEWAINKTQLAQTAQTTQNQSQPNSENRASVSTPTTATEENNQQHVGWAGVHVSLAQNDNEQENLKELILLDSDSNATVFCERKYVTKVWKVEESMGLGTNGGGSLVSNMKCTIPHLGEQWFNPDSMTNIIAMKDMTDRYRVTMDSAVEKALFVHLPDKVVIFKQLKNNLYGMNPNDPESFISEKKYKEKKIQMMNIVEDNLRYMSESQQNRARKARKALQAIGTPTTQDLKAVIRMNMIKNSEITTEDVNLAEKAFGPDVGALKSKTTRRKPAKAISNVIEIPTELLSINEDITLSIDGLEVNSLKFLTTISHDITYRTSQYVVEAKANKYEDLMQEIYYVYKKAGFTVMEIHCDNEFHKSMDSFANKQDPPIRVNYSTAQEHVPRAERNNRTIQERTRCNYYQLPYNHLCRILVKYLVIESTKKINFFPAKHGVSKYYSPRMILHKENLDFKRHCKYVLGEYVQATSDEKEKNNNKPRTLDCLYLRPTTNHQGGFELLHLATNRVITRHNITSVAITPSVIKQVHEIAKRENMPKGLKIQNRTNVVLFDASWTAGVDYDNDLFEEQVEDEDYDSDMSSTETENLESEEMDDNELGDILEEQYIVQKVAEENEHEENEHEPREVEHEEEIQQQEDAQDEDQEDIIEEEGEDNDEDYQEDTPEGEHQENAIPGPRRSGRRGEVPTRFGTYHVHLHNVKNQQEDYSIESAQILAHVMCHYNNMGRGKNTMSKKKFYQLVQTYTLKRGIKKFGIKGKQAAYKEIRQLHDRVVFKPVRVEDLTTLERRRAMESLIFLTEKRDKSIKARTCADGSTQRAYIPKEEAASPTAATESILLTGAIEAKQKRDVMTLDVPNAFVQTTVPQEEDDEKIIMKIRGALVDMLLEISPETYSDYVIQEGKSKIIYVQMMKALYGMMKASVLYYKKFRGDIENIGYVVNPYDPCVANKVINGKQHTITWHVDDIKASHVDSKVNDEFHAWCEKKYGNKDIGHVTTVRGKKHDYLAMNLDYSEEGKLKVDMKYYIDNMIEEFPYEVKEQSKAPWNDKLFKVNETVSKLDEAKRAIFHTFVMKAMFLCKRARPDVEPAVSFLSTRTSKPDESDWVKLLRMLGFLKGTINDVISLEVDDSQTLRWYIDAAFAIHPDMKSHTGLVFTLGKGAIISGSTKQKTNSRSSTEAELNAADEKLSKIIQVKKFLECQGFKVKLNIIFQDNTSTMKLQNNGKISSGKRTRHFDIKLFYITDLISRDEVTVIYCPTDDMIADYMSKPVMGTKFKVFRDLIMNLTGKVHRVGQQECVGQ